MTNKGKNKCEKHLEALAKFEERRKGKPFRLPVDEMLAAIEELRAKKDIQRYADAYSDFTQRDLARIYREGRLEDGAIKDMLDRGKPMEEVARYLATDKLSYLIGHFENSQVRIAWNKNLPLNRMFS